MKRSPDSDTPTTAVALHYNAQQSNAVPFLSAKASGHLATQLVAIAEAHAIPIVKDPRLAEKLTHLQILEAIPESLYEIVAHILVFVYNQNADYRHNVSTDH